MQSPYTLANMREEPVIYINRKPFLFRELERPYKEYVGILENRLRESGGNRSLV